jgi:hypothetical protein
MERYTRKIQPIEDGIWILIPGQGDSNLSTGAHFLSGEAKDSKGKGGGL